MNSETTIKWMALATVLWLPAALPAQPMKGCKVGDRVEVKFTSDTIVPGTVTKAVPSSDRSYYWCTVEFDNGRAGTNRYFDSQLLREGTLTGGKMKANTSDDPADAFGTWSLAASAITTSTSQTATQTRETRNYYAAATGGTLTINANGTWLWKHTATSTLQGKWDRNPKPDGSRGIIRLGKGSYDRTWYVRYSGVVDGRRSVNITDEGGVSHSGFR